MALPAHHRHMTVLTGLHHVQKPAAPSALDATWRSGPDADPNVRNRRGFGRCYGVPGCVITRPSRLRWRPNTRTCSTSSVSESTPTT